jgi:hypothetical protein
MKYDLVFPLVAYVLYLNALAILNFIVRLRSVRAKTTSLGYFKTYGDGDVPEKVIVVGRHYDNQFQVPMLFFLACIAHMVVNQVNIWTLALAWAFIGTRLLHSVIHLGSNNILRRASAFALGWFVVSCLWLQLAYFVLQIGSV